MSKITFRAEDELVDELEDLDLSKSEAMREALRSYLDSSDVEASENAERDDAEPAADAAIDDLVRERVDEVLAERFGRLTSTGGKEREHEPDQKRGRNPRFTSRPADPYGAYGPSRRTTGDSSTPAPARTPTPEPESNTRDVNVTISLEGDGIRTASDTGAADTRSDRVEESTSQGPENDTRARDQERDQGPARRDDPGTTCGQCGESVDDDHVYCPNCGEKASRRLFCDCGDELRSDWAFCPSCGRRTPSADVLESG